MIQGLIPDFNQPVTETEKRIGQFLSTFLNEDQKRTLSYHVQLNEKQQTRDAIKVEINLIRGVIGCVDEDVALSLALLRAEKTQKKVSVLPTSLEHNLSLASDKLNLVPPDKG